MRRLFNFIFGYRRFKVDRLASARLLELLMKRGINSHSAVFSEDTLDFSVSFYASKKLLRECAAAGIEVTEISTHGLPTVLLRYRKRAGLFVGTAAAVAIVIASSSVIFDVRVDGNRRLSDDEVILTLRECGLHLGDLRRRVDTDAIENRVMIYSDDISWISINIIGNVAEVQIRETEVVPEPEELYDAANIIAAKDGFIERFEDTRGNIILEVGDFVREGELIVSGLYDSVTEGVRYTSARGRVMARTSEVITLSVPLEYEKKVYTGMEITEKYLIFFEKELKFFGKCGNLPSSCDTIETVEYLNLFGAGKLPVGVRTVRNLEYGYESDVRTETEARSVALCELEARLSALSESVELLKKTVSFEVRESELILRCEIEMIEDIAKIQEIIIS